MASRDRDEELPRVFRGSDAVAAGALTPGDLRSGRYPRLLRGVYTRRDVERTHSLLCEAAGLLLPPSAMITGASAATILGLPWLRPSDEVEAVLPEPDRRATVRGIRPRRSTAGLGTGRPWLTTQLAPPERVAFDAAARVPLHVAVGRLDALAHAGHLDLLALAEWLHGRTDNDLRRVRQALEMADPRAESLPESEIRVVLRSAGFDVEPQYVIHHAGRRVARVDLAIVAHRLAIEYDGAWHVLREQLARDRERMNRVQAAGWRTLHVTAEHRADHGALVDMVRRATARA